MSTIVQVTDKKKRNLLYIIYIHFSTNSEKICTWFLKSWSITYEQDVWWSYTHGNKPNMDRSVLTILVQLTAVSLISLRALPLRSACWTSTHVNSSSNISGVHSQRPEQNGRKKTTTGRKRQVLSSSTSVQRTQCLRQHAKWIPTWHMDSGSSDDITNIN